MAQTISEVSMKSGLYSEFENVALLILDFDKTFITGHLHQYFYNLYPNKSPLTVYLEVDALKPLELKVLLLEIALFTFIESKTQFASKRQAPLSNQLFDIFRSRENVIEKLNEKFDCDFSKIDAFLDEQDLRDVLQYRADIELPTAIATNSIYVEVIRKVIGLFLDDPYFIKIYSPNRNSELSARENFTSGIYYPVMGKYSLIQEAITGSGVIQGEVALIDDEMKNCQTALEGGINVKLIPCNDVLEFAVKEPLVIVPVAPPRIGSLARAMSSTSIGCEVSDSDSEASVIIHDDVCLNKATDGLRRSSSAEFERT